MRFRGGQKNCPIIVKGARMYEPRDYEVLLHVMHVTCTSSFATFSLQSFIKVREFLETSGNFGDEYWVGTRKNSKGR